MSQMCLFFTNNWLIICHHSASYHHSSFKRYTYKPNMKLLSTLILSVFVASVQSSKYADVKYDMVATSKSSKSRSISSSSSSKSGKSSYFHDELATQYIRVRAGKVRRILYAYVIPSYRFIAYRILCLFIYIIVCILILLVYYSDVNHTHRLMGEEEEVAVRNLVRRTSRNPVRRTRVAQTQRRNLVRRTRVVQRAVMLARKAAAVGVAGLTHPSQAAPLLQGMFVRFW